MNSNDDVFLKQMKGVSPIKKNNRKKKEDPKINYKSRKKKYIKKTRSYNPKCQHSNKKQPVLSRKNRFKKRD